MSVFGLKVWETAALEAGITPASRNVWEGHQWERDPPPLPSPSSRCLPFQYLVEQQLFLGSVHQVSC